jgi:pilus assembly protein CpaF
VLLHVSRDRGGRRQLAEIAVLRRSSDGLVTALTAWHVERGFTEGMADLSSLLAQRGRA